MSHDTPPPASVDLPLGDRLIHFEPVRRLDGTWDDSGLFAVVDGALLSVTLSTDGRVPTADEISEVVNVEDDPSIVDAINQHFGTSFTRSHFPGR